MPRVWRFTPALADCKARTKSLFSEATYAADASDLYGGLDDTGL